MSDAPLILGVSGLRGIVGQSLTPEVAVRYAAAFGDWLKERSGIVHPRVVIGRDGRIGGEAIYQAAISGLLSAGCRVFALGVATTPTVGCVLRADSIGDGALIVTASHNPTEWNGLKCLVREWVHLEDWEHESCARAPFAAEAQRIIDRFQEGPAYVANSLSGELEHQYNAVELHNARLTVGMMCRIVGSAIPGDEDRSWTPVRSVLDAVNCSGSTVAIPFLEKEGSVVALHATGSGIFPHTPEPTRENLSGSGGLCDAVPGLKADIGFAQDPDADRLAIVDEKGHYIGEEYTLALCAMSVLEAMGSPSARAEGLQEADSRQPVLVANLSTSRMIDDVAARYGARVERTPVGEANVVERMLALKAAGQRVALGGEGNGGVIWPEVVYVRDSLGSMALTLALMARTGKSVSQLVQDINALSAGGSGYAIVKRKVNIASKADAEPAVQAVTAWAKTLDGARLDTQDGVRVDFDTGDWAGSWVHVRASNTEPIMRLICESPTEATAASVLTATEHAIAGT